jgi:hypothetical protein
MSHKSQTLKVLKTFRVYRPRQLFSLTLLILLIAGCGSPSVTPVPTPTPPPPPAAPVMANPSANWQLYVTGMLVGDAAAPLLKRLALPEPAPGRQWLILKLTLENISATWLALPAGGISGGLRDSASSELALVGVDFASYTRLPDGEDIVLAPRFQAAGLAWVEIPPNHTPTDIWLDIAGTETGQPAETVRFNAVESPLQPPPLFNAIQLSVSPPGTIFDFPNDLRTTVTSVQLESATGDQFRVRIDLDLENTGGMALALAGDQFAQIWGMDKGGRYFCCLDIETGQGGDFSPDKQLAPGQVAHGYLATQPFTPETGAAPEALVMLTIRGRTNAVTEIFLAKVQPGAGGPVSTAPPAASLLPANLPLMEANGVAVVGNTAYLTDNAGLHLLDIANPTAPKETGFYPAESAAGLMVDGYIAYLLSGGQLHLVDVSNPAAPQQLGLYPLPGAPAYLTVAGQTVYLGAGQAGLVILDVSNPAAPRELGLIAGDTSKVAVLGQTVYTIDGVDALRIFDVSNPTQPHLLGAFRPGDVITDLTVAPSPADPSTPLAYLGTLGQGVRIVDVSNPAGPRDLGAYPSQGSVFSLALAENRLYVANGWGASGLSVVDISNPALPVEVSYSPAAQQWGSVLDVAAAPIPGGVNVYIANWFEGLLVYPDAQ